MDHKYEAVIGLEVHAQLSTKTKIFCGCSTAFIKEPNINICPICLGHPGVLPVLNKKAVEYIIKMGLAVNCRINQNSYFARKSYFYPDLPKGYQISQYELPVCEEGFIIIKGKNNENKKIRLTRIHLEEDAGKLIHGSNNSSYLDANRCGIPLIEIVSEPDLRSPDEAYQYLTKIKQIVQYLGICDGNMEEGSLRCDANVSIRKSGEKELGTKTEIKNLNSFRNVERALTWEIERQIDLVDDGYSITQETLLWNNDLQEAVSMRSKEEAHDYKYFPEPDLPPLFISEDWKKEIFDLLPELPDVKYERFINEFKIPEYDAGILTSSKPIADYYESIISYTKDYKSASNWLMVNISGYLNENKISINEFIIPAKSIGKLIDFINEGRISSKIAKDVFDFMLKENKEPEEIIKEHNLVQLNNPDEIVVLIESILKAYPNEVEQYRTGKEKVFGFFVGKVMKESKGKANPQLVNEILKNKLNLIKHS